MKLKAPAKQTYIAVVYGSESQKTGKNKVHLLCSYGYAPDQTPALLPGENDNATVNTISYQ
ncbi:hypothetical protein T4E_3588 [Trichinella pseudospiralis]|uniref:Uncharacterized protein n=1 Tax=Trichinella pseudospiralis TaxID=6337 RepID=A0A0V0XF67_TRIPS|nr:hypothetical protein T4E_3588 [Trichinella pseudospiralis]